MLLQDKVLLVIGSTPGIGEATARLCVAEGAQVMVHGLEADLAQALCRELGERADYYIADLEDPNACNRTAAATVTHFGRLDGLVNNAAVTTRSTLENADAAVFDPPTGRWLTPEEVARHVVFWPSDAYTPAYGVVYELEQYSFIGRNVGVRF